MKLPFLYISLFSERCWCVSIFSFLQPCFTIHNCNFTNVNHTIFYTQLRSAPAFKVNCIFKIFRAQNYLTVPQYFDQNKHILSVFQWVFAIYHWHYIPLAKDQSSFYEIRGLAICINMAFNEVNRKQLNILRIFLEYLKNVFAEDDLVLKVAWQIRFWGLIAHKPVAHKDEKVFLFKKNFYKRRWALH